MTASSNTPSPAPKASPADNTWIDRSRRYVLGVTNLIVMALSVILIVWISIDTFEKKEFLQNSYYMKFQLWVCLVFIADIIIQIIYTRPGEKRFTISRVLFFLISIPYLNIISQTDLHLGNEALYFIRFVPLVRGAVAMAIVMGYLSSNAIGSLFTSYITIIVMVTYFCSLIFFQLEHGVNPQVDSYWNALWWSAMNMTTVGCNISPVTAGGKITEVVLPVCGMIMFPLFTVYLTDYVTRKVKAAVSREHDDDHKHDDI